MVKCVELGVYFLFVFFSMMFFSMMFFSMMFFSMMFFFMGFMVVFKKARLYFGLLQFASRGSWENEYGAAVAKGRRGVLHGLFLFGGTRWVLESNDVRAWCFQLYFHMVSLDSHV